MNVRTVIAACVLAVSVAGTASAATVSVVTVDAKINSIAKNQADNGLVAATLKKNDVFSISVDPEDLWSIGNNVSRHLGNADGAPSINEYTFFGQSFNHGTLVGRIGTGAFFKVGTSLLNQVASASGVLRLFMWDINMADNSGSIEAQIEVSAVPLPAGAPLLLAGLGALVVARRRKAA